MHACLFAKDRVDERNSGHTPFVKDGELYVLIKACDQTLNFGSRTLHQRYESFVTNHKFRDQSRDLGSAEFVFNGTLVRVKRACTKSPCFTAGL